MKAPGTAWTIPQWAQTMQTLLGQKYKNPTILLYPLLKFQKWNIWSVPSWKKVHVGDIDFSDYGKEVVHKLTLSRFKGNSSKGDNSISLRREFCFRDFCFQVFFISLLTNNYYIPICISKEDMCFLSRSLYYLKQTRQENGNFLTDYDQKLYKYIT